MARKPLAGRFGRKANPSLVQTLEAQVDLLGAPIDRLGPDDALARIETYVGTRTPKQIATVNLDFLRIARQQPGFAEALRTADLALADGMPLVWASRLAGSPVPGRVAGVDLVDAICDRGSSLGWSVFLLGAAPGVAQVASEVMVSRHPGLCIAGVYSPPMGEWDDLEEKRIRDQIVASGADVLFVALGAPRQDMWIAENKHRLGVPVSIGVGCSFDVICGETQRAPRWMQHVGLEWLFRLITEPRRLWRRYLSDMPTFGRLMFSALHARFSRNVRGPRIAQGGAQ